MSLDQDKLWTFKPDKRLKIGDTVGGGDIIGSVFENDLFHTHSIMIPPKINGTITEGFNRQNGQFTVGDSVCTVETPSGQTEEISLRHFWPVRNPRPIVEKLAGDHPLYPGQRVLDALFPSVQGGTCAIP